MSAPVLALRDVRFERPRGAFTLRVRELVLEPGERVALIGPSGSGKTTLLHLAAGLLVPREGAVELAGFRLSAADDRTRRAARAGSVGLVLQELELLEYLSVQENVLLPYHAVPTARLDRAAEVRARKLLVELGLEARLGAKPARLSQGERQRVAVARALVTEPRLLLGDEPTGSLDPANTRRVLELMLDYAQRSGAALLMVTHDHGLLEAFDRVVDVRTLGAAEVAP